MSNWELLVIAVGLSMDACAVSVSTGLTAERRGARGALVCGLYFGAFQALMPLLGWLVGAQFAGSIASIDHWVVFGILAAIGGKMIFDSFGGKPAPEDRDPLRLARMLPLAVATSIDALAVGVGFSFIEVSIVHAVAIIGAATMALSAAGYGLGRIIGGRLESKARLTGGIILVLMGVRILVAHLSA
jgi:putative Mn2+ efflux pump MntP